MNIKEELKKFKPKLQYDDLRYISKDPLSNSNFYENDELYSLVQQLASLAVPTFQDEFETKWGDFYLPVRNSSRIISVPFDVQEFNKNFSVWFPAGRPMDVRPGNAVIFDEVKEVFEEALRFVPWMKNRELVRKTVPYNLRTGKIKRKHYIEDVMSQEERDNIWQSYQEHVRKKLEVRKISLNDYLTVAEICYKVVKGEETERMSPLEMYRRWSDTRFEGMLDIEDPDSIEEFMAWNNAKTRNHPFEILKDSIHLYPPDKYSSTYRLSAIYNPSNERLIELMQVFIEQEIPFEVNFLDEVLDHMTGEEIVEVNTGTDFYYFPSRENYRKYFHHIEWDDLKFLEWK